MPDDEKDKQSNNTSSSDSKQSNREYFSAKSKSANIIKENPNPDFIPPVSIAKKKGRN
jgi:hypothetical protein